MSEQRYEAVGQQIMDTVANEALGLPMAESAASMVAMAMNEADKRAEVNADLLAALKAFIAAMDMHLGHNHEVAICKADDQARALLSSLKIQEPGE